MQWVYTLRHGPYGDAEAYGNSGDDTPKASLSLCLQFCLFELLCSMFCVYFAPDSDIENDAIEDNNIHEEDDHEEDDEHDHEDDDEHEHEDHNEDDNEDEQDISQDEENEEIQESSEASNINFDKSLPGTHSVSFKN